MGDKSVETLGSKIRFLSVLVTFSPLPPKTMLSFLFFRLHRPQRLHNIELGAKSVSTTFVAHCRFTVTSHRFSKVWFSVATKGGCIGSLLIHKNDPIKKIINRFDYVTLKTWEFWKGSLRSWKRSFILQRQGQEHRRQVSTNLFWWRKTSKTKWH